MTIFDFNTTPETHDWLVEPIIPLGQLCLFLAQSGVGKSLIVEDLAVHIISETPFCGFKTVGGDVLIIDQDTPNDVLTRRLIKFGNSHPEKRHNLYIESMKGYSLADGTVMTIIKDYPTVQLVIIDCLHSVCGSLNPNYTNDMNVLARLKKECLTKEKTIILNHHITEKVDYTVDRLMANNPHLMAMGNSAIIQQADTYYIIGASAENGVTDKMYVRPVAKRVSVKSTPLILRILQPSETSEKFEYLGEYTPELSEAEADCIAFFRENPSDRTVRETYEGMGHLHGEKAIREALSDLSKKGLLVLSRHQHNLFKYRLP